MNLTKQVLEIDGENIVTEFELRETNAVIMHGAGVANRTRAYGFAETLAGKNIGSVLFDFSGHGDSSGQVSELSLERRRKQASGVIDQVLPADSEFYLMGFSMAGQTVCDLLPSYQDRVPGILLACPAVYNDAAHDIPFGNPKFTEIIRTPESWRNSQAYTNLEQYAGKTAIVIGELDEVIPEGVIELLRESAQNVSFTEYPGVEHKLMRWLSNSPAEAGKIADQLIATAQL
ncbi:MAG TPA: alpha/beta fold hydrolase [Candidatus Saccharimonadales bacterium]|nr:alpha/beta fold hydrolase [Candidatus Saccharimonadales bacterium]